MYHHRLSNPHSAIYLSVALMAFLALAMISIIRLSNISTSWAFNRKPAHAEASEPSAHRAEAAETLRLDASS